MTAKEQKIKEAYGEYWETFNESSKKCAFKHDGFIASILEHRLQNIETEYSDEKRAWRPKSLQGIETNNGWIAIYKKSDLPKERTYCWFLDKQLGVVAGEFLNNGKDEIGFILANATHYKLIEKPLKPLY